METLKELLASLRASIGDRLANPLTGAFLIAWPLANFKLLVVVFSEGEWAKKLRYIDTSLYPEPYYWFVGFAGPLLVALAYVFIYPTVSKWIIKHYRARQRELREIELQASGEMPITVEERRALLVRLERSEAAHKARIKELEDTNSALAEALASAAKQALTGAATAGGQTNSPLSNPMPKESNRDEVRQANGGHITVDVGKLLTIKGTVERDNLKRTGVTPAIVMAIEKLSDQGRFTIQHMAKVLGISLGRAYMLQEQMVQLGLAVTLDSGLIQITSGGIEVFDQVRRSISPER